MTSNQKNWTVLLTTMLIIGSLVMTVLQKSDASEQSVIQMLRLTAWISFLIYLLAFAARPARQLFKTALTKTMLMNRRYIGIAFAGSHTVHLVLIILFVLDPNNLPPTVLVGGTAYALLYLMLITSFDAPAAAIGPVAWRRLHKTGLYWIGATFTFTVIAGVLRAPEDPWSLLFAALLMIAITLRVIAYLKGRTG